MDEIAKTLKEAEQLLLQLQQQYTSEHLFLRECEKRRQKNLKAFEKYIPDIAKKFQDYHDDIKLFPNEDGMGNAIDPIKNVPIYDQDPIAQSKTQVEQILSNPTFSSIHFKRGEDNPLGFIHLKHMNAISELYYEAREKMKPISQVPDRIGCVVMFGMGLGYHLPFLLEKVEVEHLFICEPRNEFFYASLCCFDWESLLKHIDESGGCLYLTIGTTFEYFTQDFLDEIRDKGTSVATRALIYQHYPSEALTKIIERFQEEYHLTAMGWGFFDDAVISVSQAYRNIKANIPTLLAEIKLPRKYQNMPVFLVGNGPSLDQCIEVLKENEHKAVVIACGSAGATLIKLGIIPDFQISLERTSFTTDWYVEVLGRETCKQLNFLTVNIMHPDALQLFKWSGSGIKPGEAGSVIEYQFLDTKRKFRHFSFCNPLVANTALAYAVAFGFKDIYLFGIDNGYKDLSYHHSKSSVYYDADGNEKKALSKIVAQKDLEVEGNFGGVVYTSHFYDTGRFFLERLLQLVKVNCFNCSDGAKIESAFSVYPEDVMIMDVDFAKEELVTYLKDHAFEKPYYTAKDFEALIHLDQFDEMCDDMVDQVKGPFKSRSEVSKALQKQSRYVASFAQTTYRHLYFLLDGSVTYAHATIRMMLFSFEDEKETLKIVRKMLSMWQDYIRDMKIVYRENWNQPYCEETHHLIEEFKDKKS
ncbi:motility associated factor glycosyltransferase family protein [Algicola sagamiensis]|uniref:motility associated factor glycosyltransferase family protein n=1 Tax=Algicola sagamiensis TaxID=163869 RepID=UPI00035D0737|nr:6-hydroxymethylpterin diphosphokinase MptE-like protein [Algicola sagamiensis]